MPATANVAAKSDNSRALANETEKLGSSSTNPFEPSSASLFPNGDLKEQGYMHKRRDPAVVAPRKRKRTPSIYLNKFRVPIYIQLCVVICILCGLCVMVVAVTTVFSIAPVV